MPSNQTAKTGKGATSGAGARRQPQSQPAARSASRSTTGVRDESYALISVLYHALQGAETLDQYIQDARNADDDDLVSFFEETKESYVERAAEAKQLLASRLEASSDEDVDEDEEEDEEEEEDEDEL